MSPTPKDDPKILDEWQEKEIKLVRTMPRYKAHQTIAKEYGCREWNVYYWLTPQFRRKTNEKRLLYYYKHKSLSRKPLNRKSLGLSEKKYNTYYRKIIRNLHYFLKEKIFIKNKQHLKLENISKRLCDQIGIKIEPNTIYRIIEKYKLEKGYSPLIKAGKGTYGLSRLYYKHNKVKPVRNIMN